MVDLAPFRGLRYVDEDLAEVTAPPYDAIDADLQAVLHDRHPHNVVRLELPLAEDRYRRAADCYGRWLAGGVLRLDDEPSVTVYQQRFAGGRQRGVLVALRLEPWTSGIVLPHERVFPDPVADRLRLLEALPANTSPVYVTGGSEPASVRGALDEVVARPAEHTFDEPLDGVRHEVWREASHDVVAAIVEGYREATVLVADGHHRYTTALEFLARHPRVPGADRILAFVVGAEEGPVVRPMHRLVRTLPQDVVDRAVASGFEVRRGAPITLVTPREEIGLEPTPAARRRVGRDVPDVVRRLDTAALQAFLVGPLGIADTADELVYTPDEAAAREAVADGAADGLFLVPAATYAEVRAVAGAGALMPPKSTSFFPKPRTGIVLRPLDA